MHFTTTESYIIKCYEPKQYTCNLVNLQITRMYSNVDLSSFLFIQYEHFHWILTIYNCLCMKVFQTAILTIVNN